MAFKISRSSLTYRDVSRLHVLSLMAGLVLAMSCYLALSMHTSNSPGRAVRANQATNLPTVTEQSLRVIYVVASQDEADALALLAYSELPTQPAIVVEPSMPRALLLDAIRLSSGGPNEAIVRVIDLRRELGAE